MQEPKETVAQVNKYPFKPMAERNISRETCEKYGVRCGVSEADGKTPTAYYFPSYNQKGKIVGYMKMDTTKEKTEAGHWTAIGSVVISNKLFGQDVAEKVNNKHRNVTITEGQIDAMSVYQAQVEGIKGTQWEGKIEPHVVSIPLGTGNAVEAILHNKQFVESFQDVTLFFDNDECTPAELKKNILKGKEATEHVAAALISSPVNLFTVTTSGNMKDASDMLQAGLSEELYHLSAFGKKAYTPEQIIHASDISLEEIMKPMEKGIEVAAFPKLMEKTWGFHKRCLTLITSPSGVGKSTCVSLIGSAIHDQGHKLGLVFLEETAKETVQRLVAAELQVNYLLFKKDPLAIASKEAIAKAYATVVNNSPALLDHFGSIKIDSLLERIQYLHEVEGCEYIILDHLSLAISGLEVTDERKELDIAMTSLASYVAAHDLGLIVVCHLNRMGTADQFKGPKLKEGEEPKPYWIRVTKESLRGSAALEQLSWVILGIEPEILPDRSRGRIRWVVLKNRPASELGEADTFTLDPDTWDVILSSGECEY